MDKNKHEKFSKFLTRTCIIVICFDFLCVAVRPCTVYGLEKQPRLYLGSMKLYMFPTLSHYVAYTIVKIFTGNVSICELLCSEQQKL